MRRLNLFNRIADIVTQVFGDALAAVTATAQSDAALEEAREASVLRSTDWSTNQSETYPQHVRGHSTEMCLASLSRSVINQFQV